MGRRPNPRSPFDSARAGIGSALRSLHSEVLREPLPERIAELVIRLDQELSRILQQKDADGT
jgi:hypothetical protein